MGASIRCFTLSCVLLIFFSSTPSYALETLKAGTPIKIGYMEFPPYSFTNAKNEASGFSNVHTKLICTYAQLNCEFISLPPARVYEKLKNGDIDLWNGISEIPDIQGHVIYSSAHMFNVYIDLHSLHALHSPDFIQALQNQTVIVIRGFSYGGFIDILQNSELNTHLLVADTHQEALKLLIAKRANYLLDYRAPTIIAKERLNINNLYSTEITQYQTRFIVSLQSNKPRMILDTFEAARSHSYNQEESLNILDYIRQNHDEIFK